MDRGDKPSTVPSKLNAIDFGTGRKAISISAGGGTACALLDNGDLKCWGAHAYGKLGTTDLNDLGDEPGEMGDALKPVPLGAKRAIAVSVGADHTCAVLDGGSVLCWGTNDFGQLGQNHRTDVFSPKDLVPIKLAHPATAVSVSGFLDASRGGEFGSSSCALLDNGSVQCWGETRFVPHSASTDSDNSGGIGDYTGEMAALPALTFGSGRQAKTVFAGNVSGATLDDGSLKLWGSGYQLGQPELATNPAVGLAPGDLDSLPAVRMGSGKKVKSISLSKYYACAVLDDKSLKCWGRGANGELGLGEETFLTEGAPQDVPVVNLGGVGAQQVATGYSHTCAILLDGTLKCWGSNQSGELGLGDTDNRGNTGTNLSSGTTVDLSF